MLFIVIRQTKNLILKQIRVNNHGLPSFWGLTGKDSEEK